MPAGQERARPPGSRGAEAASVAAHGVALFLFGTGGVLFVSHVLQLWPFTVDDTFITLRYAARLARGRGLSWNDGEAPVEGYTSFSWTLLMAIPHWFTDDAELWAKLGSAVAVIGTSACVALHPALRLAIEERFQRALAGALAVAFLLL